MKKTLIFFKQRLAPLFDFIYPPVCLVCDREMETHAPFCEMCWSSLVNQCSVRLHTSSDFRHLGDQLFLDEVITFFEYTADLEILIHAVKYSGMKQAGRLLGILISDVLSEKHISGDWIVPVPLHPVRQRERGYNQSSIYAEQISRVLEVPLRPDILKRVRPTHSQTRLDVAGRRRNVTHAFRLSPGISVTDQNIILIDDVVTSGATLNSCARVCKEGGAAHVTGIGMVRPHLAFT